MQAGDLTSKLLAFFFPLRGIAGQLETINKTIQTPLFYEASLETNAESASH